MQKLLTIIVPIYNVSSYLQQCIDSILNQTYKNLEIILVDDGSTDSSVEICDNYARIDSRIRVIHKKNGGLVSARKAGLECAHGEYAAFVDGDDWIDLAMYESLVKEMEDSKADIITSAAYKEFKDSTSALTDTLPPGIYTNETPELCKNMIFYKSMADNGIIPSIWSKVYKSNLLKEYYLCMDDNICFGEDAACVYTCIPFANRVQITHRPFYHYRFRSDSIVHQNNPRILEQVGLLYNHLNSKLQKHSYYDVLRKQIEAFITLNTFRALNYFMGFSEETKIPLYVLPSGLVNYGTKVALYGAGMVEQAYEKQIRCSKKLNLAMWVDKMASHYQSQGKEVLEISKILECDFDVVLIAAIEESMVSEIKRTLIGMGIPDSKIFWDKPVSMIEQYLKL